MFAGKKSAQIREILISESAWEEMTCLFAPSLGNNEFAKNMAQMVTELRAVKPVPGVEKVLAPNDPQMMYKEKCQQNGIPVAPGIYQYLSEN